MINILVTAAGSGIGQAVIKALGMSGLGVRITAVDISPWAKDLYNADAAYLVPCQDDERYIDALLDICKKEKIELIIPGLDPELLTLSENSRSFSGYGIKVMTGRPESVKLCRNKLATWQFFEKLNLPFVETKLLSRDMDPDDIPYPAVVKPIDGSGSAGVDIMFSKDEMFSFIENLEQTYIAQRYLMSENRQINRRDIMYKNFPKQIDEVSVQFLTSSDGGIISCFMSINELKQGVPMRIRPFWRDDIYLAAKAMVNALIEAGHFGPVNLECKITQEGPVFYEINPRFTGLSAVRAMLGFNECKAMVDHMICGTDLESIRKYLDIDYMSVCSRFISESIIGIDEFEELSKTV